MEQCSRLGTLLLGRAESGMNTQVQSAPTGLSCQRAEQFLGEVFKRHSLQVREEAPWRNGLSMGLGEVRGCDDPHLDDSSPLLHLMPRADPE